MRIVWCRSTVRLIRLIGLWTLACATYAAPAIATAKAGELASARSQAIAEYFQGRHVSAVKALRAAVASERDSLPAHEVRTTYQILVDMCTTLRDVSCLMEAGDAIRDVMPQPVTPPDESYLLFILTLVSHFANQVPPELLDAIERFGPLKVDPVTQPLLYVKFSLLAADVLVARGRPAAAATWLDAALSVLLPHGQFNDYDNATALVRAMGLMVELGQYARADYYWRICESYVRTALPSSSVELLDFYLTVYLGAEHRGSKGLVELSAREGLGVLSKIELPPHLADGYRTTFTVGAAAICAAEGDFACADYLLGQHPLAGKEDQLLTSEGTFQSQRAALFAMVGTLRRAFGGQELNASWLPAFKSLASTSASPGYPQGRAYATWVLGIYEWSVRPGSHSARDFFIEAARLRLHDIGAETGKTSMALWLPAQYDRIILSAAAVSVAYKDAPTVDERRLAVQAIEVGNRSLRQFGVDSFDLAGDAANPDHQTEVQALSQLIVRFGAWEKKRLQALFGTGSGKMRTDPEQLKNIGTLRLRYIEFVEKITELSQRLPAGARAIVPDVGKVQSTLGPGEVIVSRASYAGMTAFACVRHDRIQMAHVRIGDQEAIKEAFVDLRVLDAALTDDRAPSEQLDSQFPFPNAQRVYRWLFAPVHEACAKRGERVIWVDASNNTFPVHALSANVPPGKDGSYDLSKAAWLGRDFAFSYVVSLSHFASARRETRRGNRGTGYLGVGNPNLSGLTADGETTFAERIATRSARSAAAGLISLSQLPETEQEIRRVATGFESAGATVLLGGEATEANVRRQLLSEYGVIHFATHGVIGEELPGLTEPALVVTPVSESVTANDGLLTATEISQLALRARMVVLSACNTANFSAPLFGNEFQALSSAFLLSGSPTMMLTLWPVDSATSETVVGAAVAAARDSDMPVDKALSGALFRQAKESDNKSYLHPRFWAPFVIFGDGGVTLTESPALSATRPRLRLQLFEGFRDGGELFSVVPIPGSTDVLVSGYADLEDGRYKSLLQRVTPDGAVKWRRQDAKVAGGRSISWGSTALVAGYISGGNRMRGILSRYSFDGELLWRVPVPTEGDTFVLAMLDRGKEADVVATAPRLTGSAKTEARLLRVRGDGSVRKVIHLPVGGEQVLQSAVAFVDGRTTVLFLNLTYDFAGTRTWRDRFSSTRNCMGDHATVRVVVSNETDEVISSSSVRGVNFQASTEGGGRRYLIGDDYDPCTKRSVAGVLENDRDNKWMPFYKSDIGASTQLRTLDAPSSRRLVALGTSELTIDPGGARRYEGLPSSDDMLAANSDRLEQWFILDLDPTSQRSAMYPFSTGSFASFVASTLVGSELIAVGSVGGQPALLRAQLPTRTSAP